MSDDREVLQIKTKSPLIGLLTRNVSDNKDCFRVSGLCITRMLRGRRHLDTSKLKLETKVDVGAVSIKFTHRYGLKLPRGFALNSYTITVSKEKALALDIQNKLIVNYNDEFYGRVLYSMTDMKQGRNRNEKVFIVGDTAMYFRQSAFNSMGITVRNSNYYDTSEGRALIDKAVIEAKKLRDKDFLLMYEKECQRFEESASVLYRKMIDLGYNNVYYVVNMDNPKLAELEDRYKKNLVAKDSLEHLTRFLACRSIISTESTEHAVQLRIADKRIMDRTKSPDLEYVFLQHGVMYMVSLNSELRAGFRSSKHKLHRVVVSSEAEAEHFIELGGMKRENLYITGLAKFDTSERRDGANKIIIMPTWRRWEHNQARADLESTGYYKLVETMYNAVPEELKDRTIVLPHPLMAERFKGDNGLKSALRLGESYDDLLKDCELLITDYSSIAYDAFYRGAKVVFCWQDKDECMEHYGEGSFLMLNNDNVFGDVCMDEDQIRASISRWYNQPQSEEYLNRYRHIVEFHDNRNSERIIEKLKEDGILKC